MRFGVKLIQIESYSESPVRIDNHIIRSLYVEWLTLVQQVMSNLYQEVYLNARINVKHNT